MYRGHVDRTAWLCSKPTDLLDQEKRRLAQDHDARRIRSPSEKFKKLKKMRRALKRLLKPETDKSVRKTILNTIKELHNTSNTQHPEELDAWKQAVELLGDEKDE